MKSWYVLSGVVDPLVVPEVKHKKSPYFLAMVSFALSVLG